MDHQKPDYTPPNDIDTLITTWIRRARESQFAHYTQATKFRRAGTLFGIPVIIITAVVGTSLFSSITQNYSPTYAKLITGLFSVLAAVLSSLQTFMKLPEKAELHKKFGARYGAIRRKLEHSYAARHTQKITNQALEAFNKELNKLAEDAPDVPIKARKIAQEQARQRAARMAGNGG